MSYEIEVDWMTLQLSRQTWLELSQDLRVAVSTLEDAPTTGFSPTVAPTVAQFIEVWAQASNEMTVSAEQLSDDLLSVVESFIAIETNVADELNKMDAEDE